MFLGWLWTTSFAKCKSVFWSVLLFFGGCVFLLPVFLCFCFVKRPKKAIFLQNLEVFCLVCSSKNVLRCFFSSFFCLMSFHLFFCFFPSTPFWKIFFVGVSSVFLFLSFPFLMAASLFETKFLTSPFWNPNCSCFWHFSSVVFVIVFMVCVFLPFCFDVSVVFVMFYILFWFCFCFVSCFAFRQWKNTVFPAILSFCHAGFKAVVYVFSVSWLCFCLFILCCLFPI